MKETMEFWCSSSGGGCGGYFTARLRTNINGDYTMVCPDCGHEHNRKIVKGVVTSDRCNNSRTERIIVPKSAFSKESRLEKRTNGENSKVIRSSLWDRFLGRRQ